MSMNYRSVNRVWAVTISASSSCSFSDLPTGDRLAQLKGSASSSYAPSVCYSSITKAASFSSPCQKLESRYLLGRYWPFLCEVFVPDTPFIILFVAPRVEGVFFWRASFVNYSSIEVFLWDSFYADEVGDKNVVYNSCFDVLYSALLWL